MTAAPPLNVALAEGYVLRRATPDDAAAVTAAVQENRAHLAPWEPLRTAAYFTVEDQRSRLVARAAEDAAGRSITALIVADDGTVAGSVNLNDIVAGAFGNGHLGYWLAEGHTGRGLMTGAVEGICGYARDLGLHRVQAATLLHNEASQAVLKRTGFVHIGLAPEYLYIAGSWQDHVLFQRILSDDPPRS
ncbi:GNAT family N-acetyltransferase [Mumia zhuanghuii]|uniref:GNAT family N-acetyltransferase n=1 Tax=Mumia zhuanghuii TaxID=2585211 RepID=UPI001E3AE4B2|nr:GNAT family protein [Mumia zhuanghuii]